MACVPQYSQFSINPVKMDMLTSEHDLTALWFLMRGCCC